MRWIILKRIVSEKLKGTKFVSTEHTYLVLRLKVDWSIAEKNEKVKFIGWGTKLLIKTKAIPTYQKKVNMRVSTSQHSRPLL